MKREGKQVIPYVNGVRFVCDYEEYEGSRLMVCEGNVFTLTEEGHYRCNSCGTLWEGLKEDDL